MVQCTTNVINIISSRLFPLHRMCFYLIIPIILLILLIRIFPVFGGNRTVADMKTFSTQTLPSVATSCAYRPAIYFREDISSKSSFSSPMPELFLALGSRERRSLSSPNSEIHNACSINKYTRLRNTELICHSLTSPNIFKSF